MYQLDNTQLSCEEVEKEQELRDKESSVLLKQRKRSSQSIYLRFSFFTCEYYCVVGV